MSVEIDPPELGFRRPFTQEVTQILRLKNPHDAPVAFKVKTTAPKQYCVRPNSGSIEANEEVEVQVLLQAMKEDPPLDAKCRDKFLVQSAMVNDADSANGADGANVASLWPTIEKTAKDTIKERKIRVIFLPAHDTTPQHSVNGLSYSEVTPSQRSPSPQYGSPSQTSAGVRSETSGTNEPGTLEAASASISTAASVTKDTLAQQLENAKAQIAQLKAQIEDQGLRQRKTNAVAQDSRERVTAGTTGMGVQSRPAEGVPVQIVAALCLLSFLFAYFLF
ncbi:MAG: phosphatidylinositol-binding protein scs2 [Stictis urceolatum]|nr:phosphatidylinositol-binding protein scs2 [Stictis urceolata]